MAETLKPKTEAQSKGILRELWRFVPFWHGQPMPLLRKELRALGPFLALMVFISGMNVMSELIRHQPDMRPFAITIDGYIAPGIPQAVLMFLLVFSLGSGLLTREQDEGTIEFLDSLPLSRSRVFGVKVLLASLIFMLFPLTNLVMATVLQAWSRNSLDSSFHWSTLATSFFLSLCQNTVFLSLALALSFLRRFGWMIVALLSWAYIVAHHYSPGVAVFNPLELTTPRFEGQLWLLPLDLLKVQLPLAALLLAVAWFVFAGTDDRIARGYRKLALSRLGVGALAGAAVVTVGLILALAVREFDKKDSREEIDQEARTSKTARAVYVSWKTAHSSSPFYSFVYPANLADRAREVIERSDDVHERVRRFLDGKADGASIDVDMTGAAPRHAGVAYWNTIRLDLAGIDDIDLAAAILGHETTHVYVSRLSDSRMTDVFNSTRFFNEGLATYVENRLFGSADSLRREHRAAAAMRQRREVDFKELVDDSLLRRNRDPNLVYPLGEVFIEAVVSRYGDQAPAKLLRSLVRKDRPKEMVGMELWQDAFQSAGFSLEATLDTYFSRLDALATEHQEFIRNVPRLRGAVRHTPGSVGIEPVWEPREGWTVVCRFRQYDDSNDRDYQRPFPDEEGVFWVGSDTLPAATFWYELGVQNTDYGVTLWEPWREIRSR